MYKRHCASKRDLQGPPDTVIAVCCRLLYCAVAVCCSVFEDPPTLLLLCVADCCVALLQCVAVFSRTLRHCYCCVLQIVVLRCCSVFRGVAELSLCEQEGLARTFRHMRHLPPIALRHPAVPCLRAQERVSVCIGQESGGESESERVFLEKRVGGGQRVRDCV